MNNYKIKTRKVNSNYNKKAVATILSMILYIFVSIAVIAIVTTFATNYIGEYQQRYKYSTMLEQINKLDNKIQEISNNKLNTEIIKINNPEYLEINCSTNTIYGQITYNLNYKNERSVIENITTYKKLGKIYFEKTISNSSSLNLACKDLILNKGKNILEINYFNFDEEDGLVNIDIIRNNNKRQNLWYNSNWNYRNKIIINSDKIEGDLDNFPVLIKTNNLDIIQNSKTDGSDVVFTNSDGKTKLAREIEKIEYKNYPYYIEENKESEFYIWTKVSIPSNDTTTIYLKKEEGNTPNGDDVFLFYDDFDNPTISESKWTADNGAVISYDNGNLKLVKSGPGVAKSTYSGTNYTINAEIKHDNVLGASMGIMGRFNEGGGYYQQEIDQTGLKIYRFDNWAYHSLSQDLYTIDPNKWYYTELQLDQNKIIAKSITDNKIINVEDNTYASGKAGLQVYSQTAYFDNFFVREFANLEPIVIIEEQENNIFKIKISNINNYDLIDYQVKIPTDTINISDKNESLELYSGELISWVNIPNLSENENTEIYIYYGNTNANETNNTNTWDNNYKFIGHLNNLEDSSKYNNDFTYNSTTNTIGKINTAFDFNRAELQKSQTDSSEDFNLSNSDFTISGWFYVRNNNSIPFNWGGIMIGNVYANGIDLTGGRVLSGITEGELTINISNTSATYLKNNSWYYLTLTNNTIDKNALWYHNGTLKDFDEYILDIPITNKTLYLGVDMIYFDGKLDEVRISNTIRSSEWIKTEYNNQNNPGEFITIDELVEYS